MALYAAFPAAPVPYIYIYSVYGAVIVVVFAINYFPLWQRVARGRGRAEDVGGSGAGYMTQDNKFQKPLYRIVAQQSKAATIHSEYASPLNTIQETERKRKKNLPPPPILSIARKLLFLLHRVSLLVIW